MTDTLLANFGVCTDEVNRDLETALEVAPNYLAPRYELAEFAYAYGDDDAGAARQFSEVVERAAALLCVAAAGRIRALADANQPEQARHELDRWRAAFPADPALADSARWIEPLASHD